MKTMTRDEAVVVVLCNEYTNGGDPFISIKEVYGMAYFWSLIDTALFPAITLSNMIGKFVVEFDLTSVDYNAIKFTEDALEIAFEKIRKDEKASWNLARIAELVQDYRTSEKLYLLTSIHFFASRSKKNGITNILNDFLAHEEKYNNRQVMEALYDLYTKGWLVSKIL